MRTVTIGWAAAALLAGQVSADCVKNQSGNVVCGEGQCEMDHYGVVYCAPKDGGAVKDKYGTVVCGVGYCARDYLGRVWCSMKTGGGAAVDAYGSVKCLGGCETATAERCEKAK
jgi:hypothetical protein